MLDDDRFKTLASFEELKSLVEEDKNINCVIDFCVLGTSMGRKRPKLWGIYTDMTPV